METTALKKNIKKNKNKWLRTDLVIGRIRIGGRRRIFEEQQKGVLILTKVCLWYLSYGITQIFVVVSGHVPRVLKSQGHLLFSDFIQELELVLPLQ